MDACTLHGHGVFYDAGKVTERRSDFDFDNSSAPTVSVRAFTVSRGR